MIKKKSFNKRLKDFYEEAKKKGKINIDDLAKKFIIKERKEGNLP